MFNDKYDLTQAVLEGRKTMTRRIVPDGTPLGNWAETESKSRYKVGDVVAVAQSYEEIRDERHKDFCNDIYNPFGAKEPDLEDEPGWNNKMFVKADLMPHQIRITNVRVERLQDIDEEGCLKEGIVRCTCNLFEFRGICYTYDGDKNKWGTHTTPQQAFAALIDKVSGKGTWESNPYVFVYEFELVK